MKTTVVNGVLTSYELMLAILFRWCVQSCGQDILWLWRSHGSGHGSDHHTLAKQYCAIAYLPPFELQSFYLLLASLAFRHHCTRHCLHRCRYTIPFCFYVFPPLEMQSTLGVYTHIVVSIGNEGNKSSSALAVTLITLEVVECCLIFLGGGWPDELGSLIIKG